MSQSKRYLRKRGYDVKEIFNDGTGYGRIRWGPGARQDLQKIERKLRKLEAKELRRSGNSAEVKAPAKKVAALPEDPRAFLELFARVGMTADVRAYFEREESRFDADWRRQVDSEIARLQNF
jgi:hypothetical protein